MPIHLIDIVLPYLTWWSGKSGLLVALEEKLGYYQSQLDSSSGQHVQYICTEFYSKPLSWCQSGLKWWTDELSGCPTARLTMKRKNQIENNSIQEQTLPLICKLVIHICTSWYFIQYLLCMVYTQTRRTRSNPLVLWWIKKASRCRCRAGRTKIFLTLVHHLTQAQKPPPAGPCCVSLVLSEPLSLSPSSTGALTRSTEEWETFFLQ